MLLSILPTVSAVLSLQNKIRIVLKYDIVVLEYDTAILIYNRC